MFLKVNNSLLKLIGDPHLGKEFANGVPLNRRGEREFQQRITFVRGLNELIEPDTGRKALLVWCSGDLFDKFTVDNQTIFDVFHMLTDAAYRHPDVTFVIERGNHDVSRNTEEKSSFDILESMCSSIENIIFIQHVEYLTTPEGDNLMFVPYDAFTSASDLVASEYELMKATNNFPKAAFGHWDVEDFGNPHNLVPLTQFGKFCPIVVTGHVHKPSEIEFSMDETEWTTFAKALGDTEATPKGKLIVTGSMMPYSHGEDPKQTFYRTVTLAEYEAAIAADPRAFHDTSLRIKLQTGEEPPTNVDAYQFTWLNPEKEKVDMEAKMEVFSFKELFDECFKINNVSDATRDLWWNKMQEESSDVTQS